MAEILFYGFLMPVCSVIAWAGNVTANRMASGVARDTTQKLRHDLFEKISMLSCRQTDDFTIASLESRLTSDTYNIHQMCFLPYVSSMLQNRNFESACSMLCLSLFPFL